MRKKARIPRMISIYVSMSLAFVLIARIFGMEGLSGG